MIRKITSIIFILILFFVSPLIYRAEVYGEDEEGVAIGTDDGFVKDVLGDTGLILNIFRPFDLGGHITIYTIAALILEYAFPLLFIAFMFVVGIGVIKWISSQGNEAKIQNAYKWLKNGAVGFLSTVFVFIGVNLITWFLGIGNVYHLAEHLVVCRDSSGRFETMLEYKRRTNLGAEWTCYCHEAPVGTEWACTLDVSVE